jgi:hypothetical protein
MDATEQYKVFIHRTYFHVSSLKPSGGTHWFLRSIAEQKSSGVICSADYSSPRASISARSFLRPIARLLVINCFLPMKETETSP